MTREINGRITMRVSDDGTRCAAECPHYTPVYDTCEDHDAEVIGYTCERFCAVVMDIDDDERVPACIAAEQAAAPLVCTCATMRHDPDMPGYQMCPRCTIAHDAIVDEWTRIGSLEDAVMREIAAVGGSVVREVGGPVNVAASVAATIARLGEQAAASVPSCEEVPAEVHERGWQWRPTSDDTAFAPPFGTIRACRHCGCLVAGGPTACVRCAEAVKP